MTHPVSFPPPKDFAVRLDLSRAHSRFLGLTGNYKPRRPEELIPIKRVEITPPAKIVLLAQLDAPGRLRGGPLFGYRRDGVIFVLRAAANGYTCWHGIEHGPLDMDERYLLGYLDCLREQEDTPLPIDWVGNWLSYPNSQLADQLDEDLTWITRASQTRLIDDEHCLLIVGQGEGRLTAHGYTERSADGSVVILFHNLVGVQPPVSEP